MSPKLLKVFCFGLILGGLGLAGGEARAGLIFSQPPQSVNSLNGWSSSFDPVGYGSVYTTYDSFSLTRTTAVGSLDWQGLSFQASTLGPTSTAVQAFTISFFSNASGVPGSMLYTETVGFGETTAGTTNLFQNGQVETVSNYSANLLGGFTAAAGTTYWLSIQAVTNYPAIWSWTSGTGGDGTSYQATSPQFGGGSFVRPGDRSFNLFSIPEPSSFVLWGIAALTGLGVAVARRGKAARPAGAGTTPAGDSTIVSGRLPSRPSA